MISDLADDVRVDGAKLRHPQRGVQSMPVLGHENDVFGSERRQTVRKSVAQAVGQRWVNKSRTL